MRAAIGLTMLAAVLRFVGIGHQGFWFDEGNTALLVHLSPGKMLGLIPQSESTPPLYYCVAWVWARVFGFGEAGLRSLSALAGVALVPVAYGVGAKLISPRAGVIAAALTACNPFLVWYSQEARSYSLLTLLVGLSLLGFAYVRAAPTRRSVALWTIASAAALATHYYAFLVVVPEALWLLWIHRRVRLVQLGVAVTGLCGLALIPLALSQNGTGNAAWIAPIALAPRLGQLVPQFVDGVGSPGQSVMWRLGVVAVLAALVLLVARSDAPERRGALAAGGLAATGLLFNLALVAGGIDDLITRNVIALWPAAMLLLAGGLAAANARLLGGALAAGLCAIGLVANVGVAADRSLQRPDWRAVARVLGPAPAGGRLILEQNYRTLLPLSLYMHGLSFWRRQPSETVSEIDVVAISAPRVRLCWWGGACNLTPAPAQASYPIAGFREQSRRRAYQFTIVKLTAARPGRLTHAAVDRALTATAPRRDGLILQR